MMAQAVVARVCIPQLRLIVPMPGGLAADTWSVAFRDRCRGGIDRRRVFRGGTVSIGRMASLGVLDCHNQRNVLGRGHGNLAGQFMGLMVQAIVARVHILKMRLIVRIRGKLASEAGGLVMRDRCAGSVDRRRVFRDSAVNVGRIAPFPSIDAMWELTLVAVFPLPSDPASELIVCEFRATAGCAAARLSAEFAAAACGVVWSLPDPCTP